ncbi:MAG: gluconate 2-dehydrogenase subunit 3 family protein [Bacteroidia bacterium]
MNRRDALYRVSLLFGGTIVGAQVFLEGCGPDTQALSSSIFTPGNLRLLDEVGETILPTTADSPGAKAAGIGAFMQTIVSDCYTAEERKVFLEGIVALDARAQAGYQRAFLQLEAADRHALLLELDAEAKAYEKTLAEVRAQRRTDPHADPVPAHYFTMMKQLTVWGYFSSEVGATQALRYVEAPGRYEGCIPYEPGQKAWALS